MYRWDLQKGGAPITREFSVSEIRTAIMLPDGKIATVGSHHNLSLATLFSRGSYPTAKGKIEFLDGATLATEDKMIEDGPAWADIAYSGDGTRIGTLASNGWMTIWNAKSRKPIASFPQDNSGFRIVLSHTGHRAAVRTFDGDVRVWDIESRRCLRCSADGLPRASSIALSPNGELLALGAEDFTLRLYSVTPPGLDQGHPPATEVLTNSIGMRLNWVPAGRFEMGKSKSLEQEANLNPMEANQKPHHAVKVTRPFYMGQHEVTVAQFRQFIEATGYRTTAESSGKGGSHITTNNGQFQDDPKLNWKNPGFPQGDDHPVVQVSYLDAVAFCEWLSKKELVKYRLPTEVEWEYSCRAGTNSMFYFSAGNWMFRCANVPDQELIKAYGGQFPGAYGDSDGNAYTASVGSYIPNGFGLFDMHGNVWEWCSDWYDAKYYENSPADDPKGPKDGADRVQRGGSFFFGPAASGWRDVGPPDQAQSHLGFRVVREIP